MQIVILIVGLILLYFMWSVLMTFLAWLNFGTGFCVIAAIFLAFAIRCKVTSLKVDKNVNWNAREPEASNYYYAWITCIFLPLYLAF